MTHCVPLLPLQSLVRVSVAILLIALFVSQQTSSCHALNVSPDASRTTSTTCSNPKSAPLLSPESMAKIAQGGVAIEHNWLPPALLQSLRSDVRSLFAEGQFQPDGLTNSARPRSEQGFTVIADRQTFRGGAGWSLEGGNLTARMDFASRMRFLRTELAVGLDRPTLEPEGHLKHEMTYNWYEPKAKLGRHLDEHHEETKGVKGWAMPTRRSVTWLVYLNDAWAEEEGGALRCFPRSDKDLSSVVQVGAHNGNLQVGWYDGKDPVFLDCFRPTGGAALYRVRTSSVQHGETQQVLSSADFDVPRQPIEFVTFLAPEFRDSFEQISTSRLDPRFAAAGTIDVASGTAADEKNILDILPAAGTLVLFDSVTLPHLVREVTGTRQRIAATGWFHEDNCFVPGV